jgi:hypothetical protein
MKHQYIEGKFTDRRKKNGKQQTTTIAITEGKEKSGDGDI